MEPPEQPVDLPDEATEVDTAAGAAGAAGAQGVDRRLDLMIVVALTMVAVPLVVALASAGDTHWFPTGDLAQAELHMRGFFRHPPLVGAAGRIGNITIPYGQGSHPGPAMWVALLPVYQLFGRTALGLMVSVAVVQFLFIGLTVWLARRLAGSFAGLATAVLAAVLVNSLGPAPFIEPWNPWLAIFAFSGAIAASWGVVCGRHSWLWLATFCGIFAAQSHAGYVPLVGALLAVSAVAVLWRWYRDRPPRLARWWWAAVATCVLMWVPPLLDQWRRSPGNLRILFDYFTASTERDGSARDYVGIGGALRAFAGEFSISGPWVRGPFRQPGQTPNWAMFALTVTLVVVVVVVLSRGPRPTKETTRLGAMLAGLIGVGVLATSRVFGEFYDYVIRWWWVIVGWVVVALLISVVGRFDHARKSGLGLLGLAAIASGAATVEAARAEIPARRDSALVGGITSVMEPHLDRDTRYLLRWHDPASLGGVPYGILLELERDGFQVGVDAWGSAAALPHRVLEVSDADEVLWIVVGNRPIADFRDRDDTVELGIFDQRSAEEQARSLQLRVDLELRLAELGLECLIPRLDTQYGLAPLVIGDAPVPQDVRLLAGEYDGLRLPVAAFTVPTDAPRYEIVTENCG